MKINEINVNVITLTKTQQQSVKGGTDDSSTTTTIIIEDINTM